MIHGINYFFIICLDEAIIELEIAPSVCSLFPEVTADTYEYITEGLLPSFVMVSSRSSSTFKPLMTHFSIKYKSNNYVKPSYHG